MGVGHSNCAKQHPPEVSDGDRQPPLSISNADSPDARHKPGVGATRKRANVLRIVMSSPTENCTPGSSVADHAPTNNNESSVSDMLSQFLDQSTSAAKEEDNTKPPKPPPSRPPAPLLQLARAQPPLYPQHFHPPSSRPRGFRIPTKFRHLLGQPDSTTRQPGRLDPPGPSPASHQSYFRGVVVIDKSIKSIKLARDACKTHEWNGEVALFSDGSYVPGQGSGIGVVWREDPEQLEYEEASKTPPDVHNNNHAEAHALFYLLHLALMKYRMEPSVTRVTAYTDSQTVLKAVRKPRERITPDNLDYFSERIYLIHEETEALEMLGKKVTLRWVKAHMPGPLSVSGNVKADKLARAAVPRLTLEVLGGKLNAPVLASSQVVYQCLQEKSLPAKGKGWEELKLGTDKWKFFSKEDRGGRRRREEESYHSGVDCTLEQGSAITGHACNEGQQVDFHPVVLLVCIQLHPSMRVVREGHVLDALRRELGVV